SLHDHADRSAIEHLIIEFAGPEDGDAVHVTAQDVSFTSSTIKGSKGRGVVLGAQGSFAKFEGNTFEDIVKEPLSLGPLAAGRLGPGNKFPKDAVIHVYAGTITKDVKWQNAGAPLWIAEQVQVDGQGTRATLEVAPGTELRFGPEASIHIGY